MLPQDPWEKARDPEMSQINEIPPQNTTKLDKVTFQELASLMKTWFSIRAQFLKGAAVPLASSRKLCFSSDLIKQKAEGRSEEMMPSYLRHWMEIGLHTL